MVFDLFFHVCLFTKRLSSVLRRFALAGILVTAIACLGVLTSCDRFIVSSKPGQTSQMTDPTSKLTTTKNTLSGGSQSGLTSIEAAQLVWPKAKGNFGDAVLWRMAPVSDGESTELKLTEDWLESDRATNWYIWYADVDGENWLMFTIEGDKLTKTDIGTRSFSVMTMGDDWPREKPAVAMKDAARTAAAQGANFDALTWLELACDYPAGDFAAKPYWVFTCSETLSSGLSLNYRIFVDAITNEAVGAINDLNERLTLPIDLENLDKPHIETHEADLQAFFNLIIAKDWTFSIAQLSYNMAPNDGMRQMWLDNFQSIDSLEVVSIEQANLVNWTDEREIFKVVLKIKTNKPVDQFGWENGENTRWITLIPQGAGHWKIEAFSSSP